MDLNTNDLNPAPWPALATHCPPGLLVGFAAVAPNAAPAAATAMAVVVDLNAVARERERCAALVRKLRRSLAGTTAKQLASEAALQIERGD